MIVTLELSADEHAALASVAAVAGVSLETVLHGLVALLEVPPAAQERETPDGDAAEERRQEQAEVEANIKRWHTDRMQP